MEEKPTEVKIKLRKGAWEIEITCQEDKIKQAIESVLAGLSTAPPETETPMPQASKGPVTCRGLIESLWRDGWFSSERSLGDVHEELGRRGYHYDRTAVAHSLTDLVREGILTRTGSMRNYRYVQKRPPP